MTDEADRIKSLGDQVAGLEAELDRARARELHLLDACRIFAERANVSPQEIAQLGVATLVQVEKGKPAIVQWNTLEDLVDASNFAMKQQATVAKFRQLKEHFVTHQQAVSWLLDRLDTLARKNSLTTVDLETFGQIRRDLEGMVRRRL